MLPRWLIAAGVIAALGACSAEAPDDASLAGLPGGEGSTPFADVAHGEFIGFTGTEPFWGGEITGGTLIYRTPDDPDGSAIEVKRFAGRGGLSFSGVLAKVPFDLMITPGTCSDGMSEAAYPFTATLRLGEEIRMGCAWSAGQPRRVSPPPR